MRFVMWKKRDNQIVYVDILRRRCVKIVKVDKHSLVVKDLPVRFIRIDDVGIMVQLANGEQIVYGHDDIYLWDDLFRRSDPLFYLVKYALDLIDYAKGVLQ